MKQKKGMSWGVMVTLILGLIVIMGVAIGPGGVIKTIGEKILSIGPEKEQVEEEEFIPYVPKITAEAASVFDSVNAFTCAVVQTEMMNKGEGVDFKKNCPEHNMKEVDGNTVSYGAVKVSCKTSPELAKAEPVPNDLKIITRKIIDCINKAYDPTLRETKNLQINTFCGKIDTTAWGDKWKISESDIKEYLEKNKKEFVEQEAVEAILKDYYPIRFESGDDVGKSISRENPMCLFTKYYKYIGTAVAFSDNCNIEAIKPNCYVENFELPQKVSSIDEWIGPVADPKYVLYYEHFPAKERDAWELSEGEKTSIALTLFSVSFDVSTLAQFGAKAAIAAKEKLVTAVPGVGKAVKAITVATNVVLFPVRLLTEPIGAMKDLFSRIKSLLVTAKNPQIKEAEKKIVNGQIMEVIERMEAAGKEIPDAIKNIVKKSPLEEMSSALAKVHTKKGYTVVEEGIIRLNKEGRNLVRKELQKISGKTPQEIKQIMEKYELAGSVVNEEDFLKKIKGAYDEVQAGAKEAIKEPKVLKQIMRASNYDNALKTILSQKTNLDNVAKNLEKLAEKSPELFKKRLNSINELLETGMHTTLNDDQMKILLELTKDETVETVEKLAQKHGPIKEFINNIQSGIETGKEMYGDIKEGLKVVAEKTEPTRRSLKYAVGAYLVTAYFAFKEEQSELTSVIKSNNLILSSSTEFPESPYLAFDLSNYLEKDDIVMYRDKGHATRKTDFYLASPCKTDLIIKKEECAVRHVNDMQFIDYGEKYQRPIGSIDITKLKSANVKINTESGWDLVPQKNKQKLLEGHGLSWFTSFFANTAFIEDMKETLKYDEKFLYTFIVDEYRPIENLVNVETKHSSGGFLKTVEVQLTQEQVDRMRAIGAEILSGTSSDYSIIKEADLMESEKKLREFKTWITAGYKAEKFVKALMNYRKEFTIKGAKELDKDFVFLNSEGKEFKIDKTQWWMIELIFVQIEKRIDNCITADTYRKISEGAIKRGSAEECAGLARTSVIDPDTQREEAPLEGEYVIDLKGLNLFEYIAKQKILPYHKIKRETIPENVYVNEIYRILSEGPVESIIDAPQQGHVETAPINHFPCLTIETKGIKEKYGGQTNFCHWGIDPTKAAVKKGMEYAGYTFTMLTLVPFPPFQVVGAIASLADLIVMSVYVPPQKWPAHY